MAAFEAVLFDWRGTLVVLGTELAWVQDTLAGLDRDHSESAAREVMARYERIPDLTARLHGIDTDAARHRQAFLGLFRDAGLDDVLATALCDAESDYRRNPFAADVAPVLAALKGRGVRVVVISDIHFGLRPAFAEAGFEDLVDLYVLSFEHGVEKPDARIYQLALDRLQLQPHQVLMVGDRAAPDGGAVSVGITTLLLPPLVSVDDRRLHLVEALVDVAAAKGRD